MKIKIKTNDFGGTGFNFPVKPKVIAGCLINIYEKNKGLTPEAVVTEARKKDHPLHGCFEWNDSKAANEHRLSMARIIICSVTVKKDFGGKVTPVRAFVNIKRDNKGELTTNPFRKSQSVYVYVDSAMSNPYLNRYTVDRALRDLQALIDKYNNLEQLSSLFGMISREIESMIKKPVPKKQLRKKAA